jgi:hypothetical protein
MRGNSHVRFLGGKGAVTPLTYPVHMRFMRKNPTFVFLIVLVLGFLIGTIANIYFLFIPSSYVPSEFDLYSLWDWSHILLQALVVFCFLFAAQKVKEKYAKIFWLFLSIVILFGIVKEYIIIRGTRELSQMISALESIIIFLVLLMFLFLHHKDKFDLFAGLKKEKHNA